MKKTTPKIIFPLIVIISVLRLNLKIAVKSKNTAVIINRRNINLGKKSGPYLVVESTANFAE
nr:hypothetical protein [Sporosarcina sp. P17b]